jgi:hypothetical protein
MKSSFRNLIVSTLAFCAVLGAAVQGYSQTTVQVDSTKPWGGWMNVYDNAGGSQGGYLWGSAWGAADLTAFFSGTNYVTVLPNTNQWNPLDPYWVNTNTVPFSGAKWMEANFYVDVGAALGGQTVTFVGDVLTNSLVEPYVSQAFIKEFRSGYAFVGMTTEPLVAGSPFTVTRPIAPGNITQYGFITTGPNADPATAASLGKVLIAVNNADPSLSTLASLALVEGQTANFTITAQGTAPLHYEWTHITPTATNILSNGGRISGATTNSLSIANVIQSDAGTYSVTVTNTRGTNIAMAQLTVVPLAQAATNYLIDPGFEEGSFASSPTAGWYPFNAAGESSTNDFYYLSATPVSVVEGTNCAHIWSAGANSYNGIFQDRPASPGEVYTANAWLLTPVEDPIGGGPAFQGSNVCYLEVQFRDAADAPLIQYSSAMIDFNSPPSTWINLTPTNIHAGDFTTFLGTSPYMVAPPGTVKVRCQVTYHADATVDYGGSVYADALTLVLREPVVTASASGSQMQISFPTLYGPKYRAYYKTNLTDTTWQALPIVVQGDGTVKTITDSLGTERRFYTVNTQ